MGTLLGIARKAGKRAPMEQLQDAAVGEADGVAHDFRGRVAGRQVTVLARESWAAACREVGAEIPWTARRANLLVEGLDLPRAEGSRLSIGEVVLEVTEETAPCQRMDEAHQGLRAALRPEWRGGVSCSVVRGGRIAVGDPVEILGHEVAATPDLGRAQTA